MISGALAEFLFETCGALHSEIVIFVLAIFAHVFISGQHRMKPRRPRKLGKVLQEDNAEQFLRSPGVQSSTYCVLLSGAETSEDAQRIFAEASENGCLTKNVLETASEFAVKSGDKAFADAIIQCLPATPPLSVVASLLRVNAEKTHDHKSGDVAVLQLFEQRCSRMELWPNMQAVRLVLDAALRCERSDLVAKLMTWAPRDVTRLIALLKTLGTERRLKDAMCVFRVCCCKTNYVYNTFLDVCIDCSNMEAAGETMAEAVEAGVADVVTYNTMIGGHLRKGSIKEARSVLKAMRHARLQPDSVTFNEFLGWAMKCGTTDSWGIVDEMKVCGLRPDNVTCTILLRSMNTDGRHSDLERAMAMVDEREEEMDEILFCSMIDPCIQARRFDLLIPHLKRQQSLKYPPMKSAHTYGSIIRAFGLAHDIRGVWDTWHQMQKRHITMTSVVLGCMVEALVTNADPDGGYKLIHEMLSNKQTQPLLNAVIYCSVLKGFSHQKRFDSVWRVYQEMLSEKVELSIKAYNALIDACVRCGEGRRIVPILEDMVNQGLEPNLITYSTILKSYCQENRLEKAFTLLDGMRRTTQFAPNEIMYNQLLDGCARQGLFDRGTEVLNEMLAAGISPSNYTLTVLVKLANRSNRLSRAFQFVEELSTKFKFQLNFHVYSNLIHSCISHKDLPRAFSVVKMMADVKMRPDARMYEQLLRACTVGGDPEGAAGLLRAACGLKCAYPLFAVSRASPMQPEGGLSPETVSWVVAMIAERDEKLATKLALDLQQVTGFENLSSPPKSQDAKYVKRSKNLH